MDHPTMDHPTIGRMLLPFAMAAALAAGAAAQGDPMREIQEIARAVDEQLQEIDRLLLESGKKNQQRERPKELLAEARERSETVEQGIDRLIEKLTEMKNQGGGSPSGEPQDGESSSGQSQPRPQPGEGSQGARRENQTPDFVQQPDAGAQPGENQPAGEQESQPQPAGQPQGGTAAESEGRNEAGSSPVEPETGPGQRGEGEGSWGELQPYLNFLRNRGTTPKVAEKYRKYYEAYLKARRDEGK